MKTNEELRVKITSRDDNSAPWYKVGDMFNVRRSAVHNDLFIVTDGTYCGLSIRDRDCRIG